MIPNIVLNSIWVYLNISKFIRGLFSNYPCG